MTSKKKRHNETKMSGGLYRIILFNGGDETIFNDNIWSILLYNKAWRTYAGAGGKSNLHICACDHETVSRNGVRIVMLA